MCTQCTPWLRLWRCVKHIREYDQQFLEIRSCYHISAFFWYTFCPVAFHPWHFVGLQFIQWHFIIDSSRFVLMLHNFDLFTVFYCLLNCQTSSTLCSHDINRLWLIDRNICCPTAECRNVIHDTSASAAGPRFWNSGVTIGEAGADCPFGTL